MSEISDSEARRLMAAGARAVRFNSPLSQLRGAELADLLTLEGATNLVDLGCGQGELLLLAVQRHAQVRGTGVDRDPAAIAQARHNATRLSLVERTTFVTKDVAQWLSPTEAAICVGASHAFGGIEPTLTRLRELVPSGRVLVGDGFWATQPDPWCLETFGGLPTGIDGLVRLARDAGWRLVEAQASNQQEWDDFEAAWRSGVESAGTSAARSFASSRLHDYEHHYRTVLSFGWLVLTH